MSRLAKPGLGVLSWLSVGALSGFLWAANQPRPYQASLTVHFPSTNRVLFQKLLGALQNEEGSKEALNLMAEPVENARIAELAHEILSTRAAASFVTRRGDTVLSPEAVEHFRTHALRMDLRPGAVLEIQVVDPQAEVAGQQCQRYLEYYDQFVQQNSITATGRVRRSLEKRYQRVRQQLKQLEGKVSSRQIKQVQDVGDDLQALGDSTRQELVQRRAQQQRLGMVVLDRMRHVRTELEQGLNPEDPMSTESKLDPLTETLAQQHTGNPERYQGTEVPRPAELVNRVRLERNYEDSSAMHRMLLLQQGILRTLEELEQVEYKVIDPLSVRRQTLGTSWLLPTLLGAFLGLMLGWLTRPAPRH